MSRGAVNSLLSILVLAVPPSVGAEGPDGGAALRPRVPIAKPATISRPDPDSYLTVKFRDDLRATQKKLVDGEWVEEPVMRLRPKDLALLIDRFQVLFERPSVISQHQSLTASTELSADALSEFIEATRGRAVPSPMEMSPLPRTYRLDD